MSKNINHIQHVKSNVVEEGQPKLPQSSVLVDGELAVNYASGYETISLKNSASVIKRFSSDDYYTEQKLGSGFTGAYSARTVTQALEDDELVWTNAYVTLSGAISSHTNDNTVHLTSSEKEQLHTHSNKTYLDGITGAVGTMAYENANSYSSATQVSTALGSKVNSSTFTAHTASTVHMSTTEKTNLDSLETNIAAISGITSTKVSNWDDAATSSHTHSNKTYLDGITGTVGTMVYQNANSYSSATEVNTALAGKSDTGHTHDDRYYTETEIDTKLGSGFTGANSANTVTKVIEDNELAISSSLNDLNSRKLDASAYTPTDLSDYYTKSETSGKTEISTALGSKANSSDLNAYADSVKYNSTTHYVEFYHGTTAGTKVFEYDASPFIIDGMVQNVEIKDVASSGTCLVVSFNTDAGKQDINIPISDIFDANNYYNKTAIDNLVGSGFTASSITDVIISDERITAAALNDLNTSKLDASAMTEIQTALNNKADVSAFTAHTASTVHMTTTEKTNLDSLETNIAAISGITSAKVTSWDNAVNDLSALTADVSGQSETVAAALNVLNDAVDTLNDDVSELSDAVDNLVSVTYSELVGLKASSALVPGTLYRITDYQCTTVQDDTSAATHNFDIIVTATDVNVLSENAKAIKHDGDTYFSASTLDAWELKYSLENDTDRFQWADDTNGKGVIWWMKDEWNNECWYDFKNIMFKRYKITASTVDDLIGLYSIEGATNITADTSTTYYCYTFTMIDTNNNMPHDVSVEQNVYYSDEGYCYKTKSNIFKPYYDANYDLDPIPYLMILPNNVFVTDTDICAIEGTYGEFYGFYDNTFGNSCGSNTFGNNNYRNTFGNYCESNTFGNNNYNNTFGNYCRYNTFGNNCGGNTFGNGCGSNTFGNYCESNTFGNYCRYNTFGNGCGSNTFGNYCESNTFGNYCWYNTFGNNCNQIKFQKDYIYYCIIENGNQYINITSTQTTSSSNVIRNFTVSQGVNNSTTVKTISHNTVNDTFKTTYQNSSSTVVDI